MICHDFKGGIGTSSRMVGFKGKQYTVGVLVQANHGDRADLLVNGVPVGRELGNEKIPLPGYYVSGGSIIIVIGTDAPFLPSQCRRLAQRATVGLARVGGIGHNGSGDIFLAFSTGNSLPANADELMPLQMIPNHEMDPFFYAVIEATEESILNALIAAETMSGYQDRTVYALPHDDLCQVMHQYKRL
jgi:D-aminopeptidase